MTIEEIQRALTQSRQELGQRYADFPRTESNIRADIFGRDEPLRSMRSMETSKIQQLYDHDKRLAENYANPQSESYLADPYARELARATQFQGTVGEIAGLQEKIAGRQDTLGDALERSMKMLMYGLEAKKFETESLEKELEREQGLRDKKLQNTLSVLGLTGGALPDEIADLLGIQRGTRIPGKGEEERLKTSKAQEVYKYFGADVRNRDEAMEALRSIMVNRPDLTEDAISLMNVLYPEPKTGSQITPEEWKMIQGGQTGSAQKPRLINPSTGETREYDDLMDPDYGEDLKLGFIPA